MGAVAFDTLKFAQTLRDKGRVPQDQAEGIAQAFADALADEMVTKTYLDSRLEVTRADLDGRLEATRADLDGRLEAARADIRAGLEATRADFDGRLEATRADLRAGLEATKADILKSMFGTIGFQTIVILGAVLALSRFSH